MKKFFTNILKTLKENKFLWKKRASLMYAIGMWTLFGTGCVLIANPRNILRTINKPFQTLEPVGEEEKQKQEALRKEETRLRSESRAIYVADNVYTPFEFMA